MKKITYLFVLSFSFAMAQSPTSYIEVSTNNLEQTNNNSLATIERSDASQQDIVGTYTTLVDFNAAVTANCADTNLISEDFANGPGAITVCGASISSAGDGCFAAGELQAGFDAVGSNGTDIVFIPAGAIGNVDPLVGAAAFADFTIINFSPDVYAVAMDIWENNDPTTIVRVYGAGSELIDTFNLTTPTNSQTFFGVVSDEPITAIELEGLNESGELYGNFLYGGECSLSINDTVKDQISLYPNPIENTLFLNIPPNISIEDVIIYDVNGKSISINMFNNQIDVNHLTSGLYFIKLDTQQGTLTKKFIKK